MDTTSIIFALDSTFLRPS